MSPNSNFPVCRNKPPSCSPLAARSFWLHGRLCQLCGCFFVRDIFSGAQKQARSVRWKSGYALYSCGCVALMAWMSFQSLIAWIAQWPEHEDHLDVVLHLTVHTMLLLRLIVNYISMLSGSSKLASFYQRASAYEKRVGISYCECCSTRKIFWIDVKRCCLCVLYIIAVALTEPQAPSELRGVLAQAIHFSTILLFTLLWLIYDIMYSVSLKSAALAFCEYMDRELHVLKIFEDYHCIGFNRQADIARRVEEVRLNVVAVLHLKREINGIWMSSIIVSSLYAVTVPCICVYEAVHGAFAPEQRLALVMYAIYTACDFATLADASQSLINKARKMKDACRTLRCSGGAGLQYQINRLHDSIDPESMAFKGADFFTLKMSLVVSMAATVITYAVILQQTTQSLKRSRQTTV